MSQSFDPYHEWLGIPPEDQPPDHYRLLGINRFESNPAVIGGAADRQMAHVRTFQTGGYAAQSQQILNALSAAKLDLLKPTKKAAYDARLAERTPPADVAPSSQPLSPAPKSMPPSRQPSADGPSPAAANTAAVVLAPAAVSVSSGGGRRRHRRSVWPLVITSGVIASLAIAAVIVFLKISNSGDSAAVARGRQDAPTAPSPAVAADTSGQQGDGKGKTVAPPAESTTKTGHVKTGNVKTKTGNVAESPMPAPKASAQANPSDPPPGVSTPEKVPDPRPIDESVAVAGTRPPLTGDPPRPVETGGPTDASHPTAEKKLAIPVAAQQQAMAERIEGIFAYRKAKDRDEKKKVAAEIHQAAMETKDDHVARFVMFRIVRDLASEAGDLETARAAISAIDERFDVDPLAMRTASVATALEAPISVDERKAVISGGLELVEEAIQHDRFDLAGTLITKLKEALVRVRDRDLAQAIEDARKYGATVYRQYQLVKAEIERLRATPNDPQANFVVGKYVCLVKQQWDRGLVMLTKGSDPAWQQAAQTDLANPQTPSEQLQAADGWWNLAEAAAEPARGALRGRALGWYEKAAPQLAGLNKARVDKLLADAAPAAPPGTVAKRPSKTPRPKPTDLFESVLGVYGQTSYRSRSITPYPFVNFTVPNKNLWTDEIQAKLRNRVATDRMGYEGTAHLQIPQDGEYTVRGGGCEVRVNGQRMGEAWDREFSEKLTLKKGVYPVRITARSFSFRGRSRSLGDARVEIVDSQSGQTLPLVNTRAEIEQFLRQAVGGQKVIELSGVKPKAVSGP